MVRGTLAEGPAAQQSRPATEPMPASPELIERSGDLKRDLLDFAQGRRFARAFEAALVARFGPVPEIEEDAFSNFLDAFVLQHRLADRRTVVDHFVAAHPELPEPERALLRGWQDVVEGIFAIRGRDGDALLGENLVDEQVYRIHSNMGPAVFERMPAGGFLIARLVPVEDEWLLSGVSSTLPAADREEVYRWAAELAQQHPALVFRNPAKREQAWQLQREERRSFIEFFGADLLVVAGHEVAERLGAYHRFRLHEVRDAQGKSAAERARETYGGVPRVPEVELPQELSEAETVGMLFDEVDGLNFLRDFGRVEETFADPALADEPEHREVVLSYLEDPSISPGVLRRLAERDPQRASQVFRRLLQRPRFSWDRDGEALLRRHKADYFSHPVLPSVTPVSDTLARAQLTRPTASPTLSLIAGNGPVRGGFITKL